MPGFKPDAEAEGTVLMNESKPTQEVIESASALWTAAAVNDFGIVKLLVEYGQANVNHLTKTHSTPLRAACWNKNLDMVRYLVEHGANPHQANVKKDTNLMLSVSLQRLDLVVYFVDELRCDLNQQDENGQTALYAAVKWQSLEITQFLIERGALNLSDRSNMTPLMLAALNGKSNCVDAFDGYCSDLEWIEARELLGTAFAGCKSNIENLNHVAEYLIIALEARLVKNLPKRLSAQTFEAFDNRRECETLEQFNRLVSSGSREALYIEALLIRERLLDKASGDYRDSLICIANRLADAHQYRACLRLRLYELDLHQQHGIPFDKKQLRAFVAMLGDILFMDGASVVGDGLFKLLAIVRDELISRQDVDYNLITLLYLLTITARVLFNKDVDKNHEPSLNTRQALFKLIRSIVKTKYVTIASSSSLLHLCCTDQTKSLNTSPPCHYPCVMTAHLLVLCGADVDAMDSARNTPLHVLVRGDEEANTLAIIDLLCDGTGSAHIDFGDDDGKTPIECGDSVSYLPGYKKAVKRLREKRGVTPLKCRCARLIHRCRVPFREHLSTSLVNFVYKH